MKIAKISHKTPEKDWRLTKQRMQIFEFVRKNKSHPTADVIHKSVKKNLPNISFGTVYRNLNFLKEHGFLKEFVIDEKSHFEGRVDSHVHFVCEKCHGIEDIDGAKDVSMIRQLKEVADKNKFYIRSENYEIRGICRKCQTTKSPAKLLPELFCIACGNLVDDLEQEKPVCSECKFQTECQYVK